MILTGAVLFVACMAIVLSMPLEILEEDEGWKHYVGVALGWGLVVGAGLFVGGVGAWLVGIFLRL